MQSEQPKPNTMASRFFNPFGFFCRGAKGITERSCRGLMVAGVSPHLSYSSLAISAVTGCGGWGFCATLPQVHPALSLFVIGCACLDCRVDPDYLTGFRLLVGGQVRMRFVTDLLHVSGF